MAEQRDTVATAGPPEVWLSGMLAWLEAEIPQALGDVVVLPPPGTAYDDVVHRAMKGVLVGRLTIWLQALRQFPAPVSPAEVQVRAETALAVAMTEAVREGLEGTKLAAFAVARLTLLKPYRPCQVWWGTATTDAQGNWSSKVSLNEETWPFDIGAAGAACMILCDAVGDIDPEDVSGSPIEQWLKQRQGDWFLTRDQVGELIQSGAIHGEAQGQAQAQATGLVKADGQ